ncbi:MAG: hypothetical protein HON47_02250 [Candidatus Diapherotrites archaeon]|uniref:Uncharacterized protein n=1 Tax=Candidatus Iainarchaeum sp. TaxID=3101447 RepID=A0A8T5GF44_9ARCH|nr:hypothetical protein [Candidatus Diapherotrites archaeon]MBT7241249.1 hypothetical protein [Candidatus Diapherotrites archaeon]
MDLKSEINKFPKYRERRANFNDLEFEIKEELLKQYGKLSEEYRNEKEL